LGVNFFINDADISIGASRAEVMVPRLKELNSLCDVQFSTTLSDELIKAHSALVITCAMPTTELLRLNQLCRLYGVSFFFSFTGGVSTSVFVDHGPNHTVCDADGERPQQKLITNIARCSESEVMIWYDHPSGQLPVAVNSGTFELSEIMGVSELNGKIFKVTHASDDPVKTVRIPFELDTSAAYISGGLMTEKKLPVNHPMSSLQEKIRNPGDTFADPPSLVLTDLLNFGAETQQHIALWATMKFLEQRGSLPTPNSDEDANAVVSYAEGLLRDKEIDVEVELQVDLIKK
jgi:hypothetical protein